MGRFLHRKRVATVRPSDDVPWTPAQFNFTRDVVEAFAADPFRPALTFVDREGVIDRRTFRQVAADSNRWAALLRARGLVPGDRLLVFVGKTPAWHAILLGALKAGLVTVPCSETLPGRDVAFRAAHSGARLVVTDRERARVLAHVNVPVALVLLEDVATELRGLSIDQPTHDTAAGDIAFILYTSGTTKDPKGVIHTHGYTLAQRLQAAHWLDARPGDLIWCTAETGRETSIWTALLGPWSCGAQIMIHEGDFDAKHCLELVERLGVTVLCQAPTQYRLMAQQPWPAQRYLDSVRHAVSAGEPLDPETITTFREAFGLTIYDGYGQTENMLLVANAPGTEIRPGSMGLPTPGHEVAVIDDEGNEQPVGTDGDIALKGRPPSLFSGYWNAPDETRAAFRGEWYITGDRAIRDENGRLWFSGRADDVIVSAGHRVGTFEVESALLEHPAVAENAVVGKPDADRGQLVKAFVVLAIGVEPSDELVVELQAHVKATTAPYTYPREIEFVSELPKTASGNVRRVELRERERARAALTGDEHVTVDQPTERMAEERARGAEALAAEIVALEEAGIARSDKAAREARAAAPEDEQAAAAHAEAESRIAEAARIKRQRAREDQQRAADEQRRTAEALALHEAEQAAAAHAEAESRIAEAARAKRQRTREPEQRVPEEKRRIAGALALHDAGQAAAAEMRRLRRTAVAEPAVGVLIVAMAAVAAASVSGVATEVVALLAAVVAVLAAWHRVLLGWRSLIVTMVLVVLFVPIKRYQLPGSLPFDLELYRVTVALVLVIWLASLLVDPRVRLRRSPFDAPLGVFGLGVILSVLANPGRVADIGPEVSKSLTFLLSFLLVYYFTVSVVRNTKTVAFVTHVLVAGMAVVAVFAIVERQTGYNAFFHLQTVFPFLQFQGGDVEARAGRLRVFGPSQHPIALGAVFALATPLAFALAHIGRKMLWLAVAGLLLLGALATTSRTAIVMLVVSGIVLLALKPEATKRLLPLAVPALVAAYVITPGAVGSLRDAFFPAGGLVAEQTRLPPNADKQLAGGRIRLLGPSLEQWRSRPIVGQGWGTRITGFDNPLRNAAILDNEWLAALLELGIVGVGGLVWLFVRAVRKLCRLARSSIGEDGWLATGLAAAIASIPFGMFTFDMFSFIQVTFLFWILLGLGAALLNARPTVGSSLTSGENLLAHDAPGPSGAPKVPRLLV